MTVSSVCLALSGALSVIAFVPYNYGVIKRTVVPVKSTWLVWWVVDMTGLAAMYFENAISWQMTAVAVGSTVTTLLALYYGKQGWERLDQHCLGLALIGIICWAAAEDARIGLLSFALCNWIGFIPTLKAAWRKPETQQSPAWGINLVASCLALIGIPDWSLAHATVPMTFLFMNALILFILYRRAHANLPTA